MSKNTSEGSLHKKLIGEIQELRKIVEEMRTNQQNMFIIPKVTADPTTPVNGQMWQNTTSNTFKIRINGVTKTVTVT